MKKLFYIGAAGLALFEILKVYFIMPMPGSQRMNSLEFAYFLHTWRWGFRIVFGATLLAGTRAAFRVRGRWKWLPGLVTLATVAVVWLFNFEMMADRMFQEPRKLVLKSRTDSSVYENSIVLGVEHNGEARAYPVRYLVYHHQVQDTIGGKAFLITYCSVCRTGRVYEPVVKGRAEKFRLVGMDHFNAMFEDASTGSWWRQATGEAVAGPLKGAFLPEANYRQLTLEKWFALHPAGQVMQPDDASVENYDATGRFERGESEGDLTRTNPTSWQDKSWVVGVQAGRAFKAYDWNQLKESRVINDRVGDRPIVVVLAEDGKSIAAFERPSGNFTIEGDRITADGRTFDLFGRNVADPAHPLQPVPAHQEFWHSWRTFHPDTRK